MLWMLNYFHSTARVQTQISLWGTILLMQVISGHMKTESSHSANQAPRAEPKVAVEYVHSIFNR